MTLHNGYCSLTEFKNLQSISSTDAVDDAFIEQLIESVSRYVDKKTHRVFYPYIDTRSFDMPCGRRLYLDADLLELTTLTNGDDSVIAATDYILLSKNISPKWGIKLLDSSDEIWETNDDGSTEQVIDVLGWWGYHNEYDHAWLADTTINEALSASDLTITMTSVSNLQIGQILKIENEIVIVRSISSTNVTMIRRGENGTTAATHDTGKTVYIWQVVPDIRNACLDIVNNLYHRRSGQNVNGVAQITATGIVITPQDIPSIAADMIKNYTRAGIG